MIGLRTFLLAFIVIFGVTLLSCQRSNTNPTDISRFLTQKIPPRQAKRNLYPLLKTDLSDMILGDLHQANEGSLLVQSNEDIERNSFIFRFDPSTGKIMDKSKTIYNFGGYQGENSQYWLCTASKASTLLLFSKSKLAEITLGPSGMNKLNIADDFYITLNGTQDIETMSCYSLTDDTSWTISLVELSKAKLGIITEFLPLIYEKNDLILLFSYDTEVFIPSNSHDEIEWGLDYWIFNRMDGELLHTDFFTHFTDDSKGNMPLSWRADDLFHQEEDALFFYRYDQGKLMLDRYEWDGKESLDKLWSFELPQLLWADQNKARSFFHSKMFSDSFHHWIVLQQSSSFITDEPFEQCHLLGIDKASGQLKNELLLSDKKMVEEWTMKEDHFLFSFDQELASINKADQKILWQYQWKRDKDQYTQVLFVDSSVFLLTYRQPNHHQIVLRAIDKTGKLIHIDSFEDKPELLEKMESNEPGFYVLPYDLFLLSREDHTFLVISNRGEVFQYEH